MSGGALGAATHLARLVPQPLMRAMVYTCRTVTARQLLAFGTVFGILGVLLALPAAAVAGVLMRFALGRYLASPLYDPDEQAPPER